MPQREKESYSHRPKPQKAKSHQSYPTVYAEDLKEMEGDLEKVVSLWATVKEKEVEETKKLWERTFDQPYEKAGGEIALELDGGVSFKHGRIKYFDEVLSQ